MSNQPHLILKPGRESSVLRRHPWIFTGAVARTVGSPTAGALVAIRAADGSFLAWGHYSPQSQICVRLISWDENAQPDHPDFWRALLNSALRGRAALLAGGETTAARLIHAESDGIPGLILDRYDDVLVFQLLTAGMESRREMLTTLLWEQLAPRSLYERSDADVRQKEGLPAKVGCRRGPEPPERITIKENGLPFQIDVRRGHKTGFYLDQRENRRLVREAVAAQVRAGLAPEILNCFSYTGGFSLYALAGGAAQVVNVDTSADALALGRDNFTAAGFASARIEDVMGDAFQVLREMRQAGRSFDLIVLDPPKFAFTQSDVQKAARGYKDINMQALHLLRPGGQLFTFSCSGAITPDLFQKILFGAALDARRNVQITGWMTQGSDHPVALTFPEGAYLKGLIGYVVD